MSQTWAIVHFAGNLKFNHEVLSPQNEMSEACTQHFYYVPQFNYIYDAISALEKFSLSINKNSSRIHLFEILTQFSLTL